MSGSNGYENQLSQAVEALAIIAKAAYWEHSLHCGADVNDECRDCKHYPVCQATKTLNKALKTLDDWEA